LDKEDAFTASLSNLAYSSERQALGYKEKFAIPRKSRFWFTLNTDDAAVQKMQEATVVAAAKQPIDAEVERRLALYRKEAPGQLQTKIAEIREFFLTEIAPRTLASSGGTIQATEVVQRLLETEVDQSIMSRFENMVNRAATLKLANFVLKYFDLPKSDIDAIIGGNNNPKSSVEADIKAMLDQLKGMPTRSDIRRDIQKMRTTHGKKLEPKGS